MDMTYVLHHVHQSNQQQKFPVDLPHDCLVIFGSEGSKKSLLLLICREAFWDDFGLNVDGMSLLSVN